MIKSHQVNTDIIHATHEVELLDGENEIIAEGSVTAKQVFQPNPQYSFSGELTLKGHVIDLINFSKVKCRFIDSDQVVDVYIINTKYAENVHIKFILSETFVYLRKLGSIKYVDFDIINFSESINTSSMTFGDYSVEITKVVTHKDYQELEKTGGYLLTHSCRIEKTDSSNFSVKEARKILEFLYQLFSFCNGVSTSAINVQGLSKKDTVIWEMFGHSKMERWRKCHNWFSNSGISLNEIAEGFYRFTHISAFKHKINELIYWYTAVHSISNNYSGVVLIHTSLELVSWLFLTEHKKVLTEEGYNRLPSGDCLSLTLGYCKIPNNIPDALPDLKRLSKSDGLSASNLFSRVRNKIIHPSSKRRDQFSQGKAVFEAKLLGIWYLELFVLFNSDFNGKYSNCLKYQGGIGETEYVPWIKDP